MRPDFTTFCRRDILASTIAASTGAAMAGLTTQSLAAPRVDPPGASGFRAIETRISARLGLSALDTGSDRRIAWRADERFPMCSTFKPLTVAAVLSKVDHGGEKLDRWIPYSERDLLSYAPITAFKVAQGGMRIADLCAAAIEVSDNTAGNLLLTQIGGPAGLTRYLRSIGDKVSRLDRTEPDLNQALPNDQRDTTTPAAMTGAWRELLVRNALSPASRKHLAVWLAGCQTGPDRLSSITPHNWRIGHKTGSGERGAACDVAIFTPPGRPPVLVAVYLTETGAPSEARASAIAAAGHLALRLLYPNA